MHVIIAGSRNFTSYELLRSFMDEIHAATPITEVISGRARGADSLGERWAHERGIPIKAFPAQWDLHGKKAGILRNIEMAKYAAEKNGMLVAFWDGESKGTWHMIDTARNAGMPVDTCRFDWCDQ